LLTVDDYDELAGRTRRQFVRLSEYERVRVRFCQAKSRITNYEKPLDLCRVTVFVVNAHV
jgi:hypothetical protein